MQSFTWTSKKKKSQIKQDVLSERRALSLVTTIFLGGSFCASEEVLTKVQIESTNQRKLCPHMIKAISKLNKALVELDKKE